MDQARPHVCGAAGKRYSRPHQDGDGAQHVDRPLLGLGGMCSRCPQGSAPGVSGHKIQLVTLGIQGILGHPLWVEALHLEEDITGEAGAANGYRGGGLVLDYAF